MSKGKTTTLKELIAHSGVTPAQAAKNTRGRLKADTLRHFATTDTPNPSVKTIDLLARGLGLQPEQILQATLISLGLEPGVSELTEELIMARAIKRLSARRRYDVDVIIAVGEAEEMLGGDVINHIRGRSPAKKQRSP